MVQLTPPLTWTLIKFVARLSVICFAFNIMFGATISRCQIFHLFRPHFQVPNKTEFIYYDLYYLRAGLVPVHLWIKK